MMPADRTSRWAALVIAAVLATGCDSDGGTEPFIDYEPEATLEQMNEVVEPLRSNPDAFLGLAAAQEALYEYEGFATAAALSLRPEGSFAVAAPERARVARSQMSWGAQLVFPSEIRGRTLVWDPVDEQYEVDPTAPGAPSSGVRLILYEMAADTTPVEPLQELGYIDLIDEDLLNSERLGIQVVSTEGATNVELIDYYVDYAQSGTENEGTLRFDARGMLSDGTRDLEFDLSQIFTWSESADQETLVLEYEYEHDGGAVLFRLDSSMPFLGGAWGELGMRVEVQGGPGDVVIDAIVDEFGEIDGTIEQDGNLVLRIQGEDPNPEFARPDGTQPTLAQLSALREIWDGVVGLLNLTEWLFAPALVLLLPG